MSAGRDSGHSLGPGHSPLPCPNPFQGPRMGRFNVLKVHSVLPAWHLTPGLTSHAYGAPCSKQASVVSSRAPVCLPTLVLLLPLSPLPGTPSSSLSTHLNPPALWAPAPALLPTEPFQLPCPLCSLPSWNSEDAYCWQHCSGLRHMPLGNLISIVGLLEPCSCSIIQTFMCSGARLG